MYLSISNEPYLSGRAFDVSLDDLDSDEDNVYIGKRIRLERRSWEQLVADFEK